jgi:hypothetical protein
MMMCLGVERHRPAYTSRAQHPIAPADRPFVSTPTFIDPAAARPPAMGAFCEACAVAFQAHEPFSTWNLDGHMDIQNPFYGQVQGRIGTDGRAAVHALPNRIVCSERRAAPRGRRGQGAAVRG